MSTFQLNQAQKKAVEHKDGPLLIIAGAGTGKTSVITQRLVWLVERELAKPDEILALTFTNKAAQEMEERVDVAIPYGYNDIWISTFHSFCDKILKQEAIYIGLDPSYILMSQAEEYLFFRSKLFDLSLDRLRPHGNPTKFMGAIINHFSRLSDEDVSPEQYVEFVNKTDSLENEEKKDYKELAKVYKEYSDIKEQESRFGFYDLVPYTLRIFREKPAVLKKYREKFKYILVDEFQDTNHVQNELVKTLAGEDGNITVVGDDDQAIYKFRGAAISNILDFQKSFPKYEKIVLTKNYRSNQNILDASYELIKNNNPYRLEVTEDIDKKLVSMVNKNNDAPEDQIDMLSEVDSSEEEKKLHRIYAENEQDESHSVAEEIADLAEKKDYKLSDIAILVRANNHSEPFVQALRYKGIPFTFPGPKGLYGRPEIKDLIAILKMLVDYTDDRNIFRIFTMPHSPLTSREFVDLRILAKKNKLPIFRVLENFFEKNVGTESNPESDSDSKELSQQKDPDLEDVKQRNSDDLKNVADRILSNDSRDWLKNNFEVIGECFEMMRSDASVGEILYNYVTESGYIKYLVKNESVKNEQRVQNISKFFDVIKNFEKESETPTIYEFVDYLDYSLEIGESPVVDPIDVVDYDAVNILTVHGAKGLEFPVVFMVNLVSQRFPTRNRSDVFPIPDDLIKEVLPEGDEHVQEERRLFYVGMTRAKDHLYLTSADYYGNGVRKKKPSVFLKELDFVGKPIKIDQDMTGTEAANLGMVIGGYKEGQDPVPPDLRKNFVENIKRNLSYSHISTYEICPYQFYFRYFLKIPGKESHARSYGMTIHNTLREFYERVKQYNLGLPGITEKPTLEDLLDIYKKKWQSEGYDSEKHEKRRFKDGKESLRKFYKKFHTGNEEPVWLENKFRANFEKFWIRGTVDRMDESDEGLEIIDYKTGSVPKNINRAKKNLQIPIYASAVEKLTNKKVKKGSLVYVEDQDVIEVDISDEARNKAIKQVNDTLKEIEKLKFQAEPGMLCKFCDYRNICDYANIF